MRKTYIDNIRWITVVLVVIYHVIYMFNGEVPKGVMGPFSDNQPQDIYQYMVYPWFMLLLFTVSGMSARLEFDKISSKEFIGKRTRKLLVPSTIGLLVWGWVLGYFNMRMPGAFEDMPSIPQPFLYLIMSLSGTGPLWFIQTLWLYSMLLIVIRKVEKDRLWRVCRNAGVLVSFALTLIIFVSAQILNVPVFLCYRFGIYLAGFLIGYFVFSHDEVMERLGHQWLLLSAMAGLSGIVFVLMYMGQPYSEHVVLDTPVCNIFAWLGTLGVLAFMKKWGGFENEFTKWMKKESYGLYVFHYLPIAASAWYLRLYADNMAPLLVYILVGAAGFVGAFLLNFIFSRIPVIRWCVLGIKKS